MFGRVDILEHESRLLAGNPLGDPARREVVVYVPPGYDDLGRLPVVLLLPAYGSNHRTIINHDLWKPNVIQRFDALVELGTAKPALIVVPDTTTRWGGSQFINSEATGPYQRYLVEEVLPLVDQHYRTIPHRDGRAVVGRSSGGFGALRLGMDHPEAVSVVGSHAGDAAFELSLRPMFTPAAIAFAQDGGVEGFARRIAAEGPSKQRDWDAVFLLAAGAAYAPDTSLPCPHMALPFDPETVTLREDVWRRWCSQDPLTRLRETPSALNQMRLVFIDAGDADEYGLQFGARQIGTLLERAGAKVQLEIFEGTHRGTSYRYDTSLPLVIEALADS